MFVKFGSLRGRELFFVTFHTAFHQGDGDVTWHKTEIDGVRPALGPRSASSSLRAARDDDDVIVIARGS
jgi:hypothetical protein